MIFRNRKWMIAGLLLLAMVLSGCSGRKNNTGTEENEGIKEAELVTEEGGGQEGSVSGEGVFGQESEGTARDSGALWEYRKNQLLIRITADDLDLSDGYSWQLHMENANDEYVAVTFLDTALNDCVCDADGKSIDGWTLPAGSVLDETMTWTAEELKRSGIDRLSEISFRLAAYRLSQNISPETGTESSLTDRIYTYLVNEQYTVFLDETAVNPVKAESAKKSSQFRILDTSTYTFHILSIDKEEETAPLWNVYLENKGNEYAVFQISDMKINGFAVDFSWSRSIPGEKKAYLSIPLWNLDILNNRITSIERVDFELSVYGQSDRQKKDPVRVSYTVLSAGHGSAGRASYIPDEYDIVLADEDDDMLVITDLKTQEKAGYYAVELYLENRTQKKLTISLTQLEIHGRTIPAEWAVSLPAGSMRYDEILADIPETEAEKDISGKADKVVIGMDILSEDGTTSGARCWEIDEKRNECSLLPL